MPAACIDYHVPRDIWHQVDVYCVWSEWDYEAFWERFPEAVVVRVRSIETRGNE